MKTSAPVRRASLRFLIMVLVGATTAGLTWAFGSPLMAPSAGWATAAAVYILVALLRTLPLDADATRIHATREDPSRPVTELLILLANAAAVVAVGILVFASRQVDEQARIMGAVLALTTVALSWMLIHTLFSLRYAEIYYQGAPPRCIEFNQSEPPSYTDFYYLSTSIGMTYQVSDTNLLSTQVRRQALKHALLSYAYGTLVLATTINLILSLAA